MLKGIMPTWPRCDLERRFGQIVCAVVTLLRGGGIDCPAVKLRERQRSKNSEDLAQATGIHAPSLYCLLRELASSGVFVEDEPGRLSLTRVGATLRTEVPGSLRFFASLLVRRSQSVLPSMRPVEAPWRRVRWRTPNIASRSGA